MKIRYIHIENYKSIKELAISDVDNALILVGRNNTGKTVVMDAIRTASGECEVQKTDYRCDDKSILIGMKVEFNEKDLQRFHEKGIVSKYKKYDMWEKDFQTKLPSFQNGTLFFECVINRDGDRRYGDGFEKHNPYIKDVFPKVYHVDHTRNIKSIQDEVFRFYDKDSLHDLQESLCIFDKAKKCNKCFQCVGVIKKKRPEDLTVYQTVRLLEYKMFHMNVNNFSEKINRYFHDNGAGALEIQLCMNFNLEEAFRVEAQVYNRERETVGSVQMMSEGLKSIYALSLLEAYNEEENTIPCIIMIEDPDIFLHPQLQKTASEILLRMTKKNQIIFSTHSPNMIFNFSSKQIRQVILDAEYNTSIKEDTDIDEILDDLGYAANDLLNVSFVFIVEGKQDRSRLPLLLEKYYSEIYDDEGRLQRISIITTNSCTNIKTYANLKYMNQLYLKDQFLMIRDGDGKDAESLRNQLCSYYSDRGREDENNLPEVTNRNVLILKYYSFENYFLEPNIMVKIGVIKEEEEFYQILDQRYKEYLYKLPSVKKMINAAGIKINFKEDLKKNMEMIKIYVRGHNLYDIFYGRYRNNGEQELLKQYVELAPRDTFKDILDAIDQFVYFENRKKKENT